jgi:hypothetical protein
MLKLLKLLATWKYGAQVGEVCGFVLELIHALRYQMTVIKNCQDPRVDKIGRFLYKKFGVWGKTPPKMRPSLWPYWGITLSVLCWIY